MLHYNMTSTSSNWVSYLMNNFKYLRELLNVLHEEAGGSGVLYIF